MNKFEERKFEIPKLKGISEKTIEEHLELYQGYVKNANLILEQGNPRLGFEFDGMRNHEIYFASLAGGAKNLEWESNLKKEIEKEYGSFDGWLARFKTVAATRGVGWAMLYYDQISDRLLTSWVDEHHLGQLAQCRPVLALDMWEHAYNIDYYPSGKKQYIEDFFENLNWEVVEKNFAEATK